MVSEVEKASRALDWEMNLPDAEPLSVAAEEIARDLLRFADLAPDGTVSWSLVRCDGNEVKHKPLGHYLGSGVLGVAVFFASLDRVRGGSRHHEICLGTVARLRRDIGRRLDRGASSFRRYVPGGMFGVGSVIYGLTILGDLLREPRVLEDAAAVCKLLDISELRREDRLDVVFGLAGLLLALLALDRSLEGSPMARGVVGDLPLKLAGACAERLKGLRGAGLPCSALSAPGYSHGASGVAHALSAFAARTGDRPAREEAEALLEAAGRQLTSARVPRGSWCNGIAGHCIARLADAATSGSRSAPPPAALFGALETAPAAHDHLCCGWSGRADILLHAARVLDAPRLAAAAHRIGAGLLERHREARLRFPHPEVRLEPRLLRGPIGVGYAFVRLSNPRTLPCLLAFE